MKREGSSSVVERPSSKIPSERSDGKDEGGSSVRIPASPPINLEGLHADIVSRVLRDIYEDGQPIEKDTLSEAKARVEALLRKLA